MKKPFTKAVPHVPAMPDNGGPRDKEERITELLEANNRLVEDKRKLADKYNDLQERVREIREVAYATQNDVVAVRMLNEMIKGWDDAKE